LRTVKGEECDEERAFLAMDWGMGRGGRHWIGGSKREGRSVRPRRQLDVGCFIQSGQHLKRDLYIISTQVFSTQSLYTDPGCFNLRVKLEEVRGYKTAVSTQVSGATEVDLVHQRSFLTVFDSATLNQWASARYCGISDWDIGIPREVTGRDCGGHQMPKAGDPEYDLYLREGYSRLWIGLHGEGFDGSTPEKRPRELDRTVGFRQFAE